MLTTNGQSNLVLDTVKIGLHPGCLALQDWAQTKASFFFHLIHIHKILFYASMSLDVEECWRSILKPIL